MVIPINPKNTKDENGLSNKYKTIVDIKSGIFIYISNFLLVYLSIRNPLIDKVIKDRTEKSGIGFAAEVHSKNDIDSLKVLHQVEPEDLISYGLIPEFVGRRPMIATLDELDEKALIKILLDYNFLVFDQQ